MMRFQPMTYVHARCPCGNHDSLKHYMNITKKITIYRTIEAYFREFFVCTYFPSTRTKNTSKQSSKVVHVLSRYSTGTGLDADGKLTSAHIPIVGIGELTLVKRPLVSCKVLKLV